METRDLSFQIINSLTIFSKIFWQYFRRYFLF